MNKKAIVFGAGSFGEKIYNEIREEFQVEFFCDNDKNKCGNFIDKIKIISPSELVKYKDYYIIVASTYFTEIIEQLLDLGIGKIAYYSTSNSFLQYICDNNLDFTNYNYKNKITERDIVKSNNKIKKVLYVQKSMCIRTYKIAKVIKDLGIEVDIAYLNSHPNNIYKNLNLPFGKFIKINRIDEFVDFINKSDYDVIHSSNEPDFLSSFLTHCNKPIIHDSHDMMSLRGDISDSDIFQEYIANKFSDANIYVDFPIMNYAVKKYNLIDKPILVLNNYTMENQKPLKYYEKLSEIDKEIHCVYEGGLSNDRNVHRFLEDKFLKLCDNKIHVHFYTTNNNKYYEELNRKSDYLHWEGVCSPDNLIEEMTRYDIGLVLLNVTYRNRTFLSSTFPNKAWEYLNAGIPIAVENLPILDKFTKELKNGKTLDFNKNLEKQIKEIKEIIIDKDFLNKNNYTMEKHAVEILNFYSSIL